MPVKSKSIKAKAKSKSTSKASNKTTVIVNVGNKKGKSRRVSVPANKAAQGRQADQGRAQAAPAQIIQLSNPGTDSMLRDIQYQMNKLNMQSTQPMQTLNARLRPEGQSPVAPPPMPVVSQIQQVLPKIPGVGAGMQSGARTPVRELPSVFTNDIFQMTPREEEGFAPQDTQPFVFPFQPAIPSGFAAPAASMPSGSAKPKESKSLTYEEIEQALNKIPMIEKKNKKTGEVEMKPKHGFKATYDNLIKQKSRTVRMKK